jgi:hypothetical protein
MNALEEINSILERENVFLIAAKVCFGSDYDESRDEFVLHVGHSTGEKTDFDEFMDRGYDPGYGGQELFGTIWFSDHRWADRGEYDGSEWWNIHAFPDPPRREKEELEVEGYE